MPKNVMYLLGAGFSAPLGIPTMRNFVDEARRLKRGRDEYAYFDQVIKLIHDTISASRYFRHDSDNVEEALSLLEIKEHIEGNSQNEQVVRFIRDVITLSTPQIPQIPFEIVPSNFWATFFTRDQIWQGYLAFVSSLFHLSFHRSNIYGGRGLKVRSVKSDVQYSVLTLNYDMLLESSMTFLSRSFKWDEDEVFFADTIDLDPHAMFPPLIKLHGSVDKGDIIPPTFNKGLYGSELPQSWKHASTILSQAHEIRVIGYSLPLTDSYIKYLLMASVDKARDLDRIDWIVRDSSSVVRDRIKQFVSFKNVRMVQADSAHYLQSIFAHTVNSQQTSGFTDQIAFDRLEAAHEEFIKKI
jgi:hypothetical protein